MCVYICIYICISAALTLAELEVAIGAAADAGKPTLIHAEIVADDDAGLPAGKDGMDYASWLATRCAHRRSSQGVIEREAPRVIERGYRKGGLPSLL